MTAATDTRAWRLPTVTARALGPHAAVIGWFPRVHTGSVRITRVGTVSDERVTYVVDAPASSFQDTTIAPGAQYTYEVRRPQGHPIDVGVGVVIVR
jgi:hypothetical protein